MGRLASVIRSTWKLAWGSPWTHDALDPSRPLAVPLEPLGPWYYDMGRSIDRGDYHLFDAQGIPRLCMRGAVVYHPSRIASFSIAHVTRYVLEGNPEDREKALRGARWLVDQQVGEGALEGAFPFSFEIDGLAPPWASALTQGLGLSALARAHLLTGEAAFAEAAVRGLAPFRRDIREGGVRSRFHGSVSVWYEEFPRPSDPSHVLNGYVYGLWGLRDVALLGLAPGAEELYRDGLASLAEHLPAFDRGYWSNYDCPDRMRPRAASLFYHHLHGVMMRVLSRIEGEGVFGRMAARWESNVPRPWCRLRTMLAKLGDYH